MLDRQASIEAYVQRYNVERFVAIGDAAYYFKEGLPWLVPSGADGLSNPATVQALRDALQRE